VKKQLGFTLIEVVVSLAIVVIIATGTSTAIYYSLRLNNKVLNLLPATNSIQIAGRWVSHDVQIANRTSLISGALPVNPAVTPVSLYRTDYYLDPPVSSTITYTVSNGDLRRSYDGVMTTVARGISSATFALSSGTITFVISYPEQNRTYQAYLRPG